MLSGCVDYPCKHGKCDSALNTASYICTCDQGFSGTNCDVPSGRTTRWRRQHTFIFISLILQVLKNSPNVYKQFKLYICNCLKTDMYIIEKKTKQLKLKKNIFFSIFLLDFMLLQWVSCTLSKFLYTHRKACIFAFLFFAPLTGIMFSVCASFRSSICLLVRPCVRLSVCPISG